MSRQDHELPPVVAAEPSEAAVPTPAQATAASERVAVERPTVRRLGALPEVTTAFGGSFNA